MIELFFDIEPVAVQSARFCRAGKFIRSYQPEKVCSYKYTLRALARKQLPAGFTLFTEGIRVETEFIFSAPKSFSKKKLLQLEKGEIIYKTTRPDLSDNLHKALNDALTNIVWEDDGLIAETSSRKRYGLSPGIRVNVFPLTKSE